MECKTCDFMSTAVPTRRALRTTRTATAKDPENANARPSRINTRAKPPSSTSNGTTNGVIGRATGATAASRAKIAVNGDIKSDHPAAKRKREALGEVTAFVNRTGAGGKGKEKETVQKFDGVVINKSKTIAVRQPLQRTVANTRQSAKSKIVVAKDALEEVVEVEGDDAVTADDNAMAIDPPSQTSKPVLPSLTIRKSLADNRDLPRRSTRPAQPYLEDELEAGRVFKKPRTSDAPELCEQDAEDELEDEDAQQGHVLDDEPEADPNGNEWDDLDADDSGDPLMVSEYVVEIFDYFREVEVATMPNPNYMANQKDLGWAMRGILSDWLIELQERFRLLPETLFLCLNIIDRFLSARVVSLARLQLVGVTCMFIAAKVEEIVCPSAQEFLAQTEASYTLSDVFNAEKYILKTLDYNLNFANPVHFLRRVSKADDYNVKARTLAKYLLEIACLEWRLIATPPSLLAAAAMWLARITIGNETWTPNLAHYSGYAESSLIPTANLMVNYILKPVKHESFYKKYARKRYLKVSVYLRRWATQRWTEGTQVDLVSEVPGLKAEIRALRAEEELKADREEAESVALQVTYDS
ncbi:G2/mitotic-specific cyclin [Paramarasmius palmivorus]|uniref:G2/mitotic-specific cyclin n=1 Tax=Paramarasmius palmivorus TaxID=297713 RepID=A0AAW0CVD5_9AGAR